MIYSNGSKGAEVGIIQNNLKMLGYDPKVIDCIFGEYTEIAVKEFQGANGLVTDGIVGDCTWQCNSLALQCQLPPYTESLFFCRVVLYISWHFR